jgi:hypothetical protein
MSGSRTVPKAEANDDKMNDSDAPASSLKTRTSNNRIDIMTLKTESELDNELCEKACRLGKHSTQAETIHKALEVYLLYLQKQANVASQQLAILDEFGQIDYYDNYDYKTVRNYR